MLKDFWDQKKHIIQFVGILIAVGALFLSIPAPENKEAHEALQHLQFLWVIIVSIAVIGLMVNLWKLALVFEKEVKQKGQMDLDGTLGIIVSAAGIYLVFNLMTYIAAMYKESYFDFTRTATFAIYTVIATLGYEFWKRVMLRFQEPKWIRATASVVSIAIVALIGGGWLAFNSGKGEVDWKNWLITSAIIFLFFFFLPIVVRVFGFKGRSVEDGGKPIQ